MEGYCQNTESATLNSSLKEAAASGWSLYPIWPVDEQGVCTCGKGPECGDPGKHPVGEAAPHGFNSASAEPQRIAEMFSRAPTGAPPGLATGRGSRVVVLDSDWYEGGFGSLKRLEDEHGRLPPTRLHQSGGGGLHHFFGYPDGVGWLPTRTGHNALAPGLELLADAGAVVLPPAQHWTGGEYSVLIDRPLAPLPRWIVDMALDPGLRVLDGDGEGAAETHFVLPEMIREGTRNTTLYRFACSLRAHGWDHDAILAELRRTNRERCDPPLDDAEVRGRARSAAKHRKGHAWSVSPAVVEAVGYLEEKAAGRTKKGTSAFSGWAVYRALLDCMKRHGRLHLGRDVAVRIAVRQLSLDAGVSLRTVHRALDELDASGLVYRVSAGYGATPGVLAVRVPRRAHPGTIHTTPPGSVERGKAQLEKKQEDEPLYKLRHGYGLEKGAGEVLDTVAEAGEVGIRRTELGAKLGREPDSLKRWLRKLVELGLIVRPRRGTYRAVKNWRRILQKERVLSGERKAEGRDRDRYEQQREEYREALAEKRERRRQHAEKESAGADGAAEPPEAPQNADGPPATGGRTTKVPEERIARLVREGMSRRWAEAEVLGADLGDVRCPPRRTRAGDRL